MIACIGDVHLGKLDMLIPRAFEKVIATIEGMIQNAVDKGCETVVFLGDISETPNLPDHIAVSFFNMLRGFDVRYHVILGNHDRLSADDHALRLLKWLGESEFLNLKVYETPETVKIDGRRFFMCPNPYVEDVPKNCKLGFGHFGYDGAKSDSGFTLASKHSPKGYWVLGDYHTAQKGKNYIYAGSVTQTKFAEKLPKGYIEVEDGNARFIKWTPAIVLEQKTIQTADDFTTLKRSVYYTCTVDSSVEIPHDWATKYPNIIRLSSDKKVSKKARALIQNIKDSNVLEGLDAWLTQDGLSEKEIRRGRRLINLDT